MGRRTRAERAARRAARQAQRQQARASPSQSSGAEEDEDGEAEGARPLAFLCDDDRITLRLMKTTMFRLGFRVRVFDDGDLLVSAIEALTESGVAADDRPDLIMVDNIMARMSGVAAVEAIRAMGKSHPWTNRVQILAMSGDATPATKRAFRLAGAASVVIKPVGRDDLVDELQRLGFLGSPMHGRA